eukprot:SAG11_NODE_2180_length_3714_cov_2.273306_1_plen_292_part_00
MLHAGRGEQTPFSHALIAALGGGGVAPGGVVGGADAALIRMTCREDGTLLKPTTPAMHVDRVWRGDAGIGEVATARTALQGRSWAFTYRVCAESVGRYDTAGNKSRLPACSRSAVALTAADIGLHLEERDRYVAYRWCGSRPAGRCRSPRLPLVQPLSSSGSFMIGGNLELEDGEERNSAEADYWVAAPVLSNGWAILGEAEALVPVSPQRLVSFDVESSAHGGNSTTKLSMVVIGSEGEAVTMLVADSARVVYRAGPCVLRGSGRAALVVSSTSGPASPTIGPSMRCAEL